MNGAFQYSLGVIKIYNNPNPPVYKSDFKFVKFVENNPNTTQFGDELPNIRKTRDERFKTGLRNVQKTILIMSCRLHTMNIGYMRVG